MTEYTEKLSAFLDGELPEAEMREIEAAVSADPALQAELEALMNADQAIKAEFDDMLDDPVPLHLAASIQNAVPNKPVNLPGKPSGLGWLSTAAALVMLAVGGAGGYWLGSATPPQVMASAGWLGDIADYHRVYSGQKRHLVEVGAEDADHIETWLTASVGADVRIPDLSAQGLTFQGARLLVAAGKPVSQLMYTDDQNRVVALCQIKSATPRDGQAEQVIDGFELVSWGGDDANFVIIGDADRSDLTVIAQAAAQQV